MIELSIARYAAANEVEKDALARRVHGGWLYGLPLRILDYEETEPGPFIVDNLAWLAHVLEELPPEEGFAGIDGTVVRRKSFCLINELGRPSCDFDYTLAQASVCDGDPESLRLGVSLARGMRELVTRTERNNRTMDRVISIVMDILRRNLGLDSDFFAREVLAGSTYRQRYISYGGAVASSSCGIHPDGNLLSFLITDRPGFRYFDADYAVHEPAVDGIICLVGSLLWRWTRGLYPPVFHYVKRIGQERKTSIVYLYNLQNHKRLQSVPHAGQEEVFVNDISSYKRADLSPDGPFANKFSRLRERVSYL